jgi:hypothetical protein
MTSRTSSAVISLVAFLGFSSALCAQRAKTPTLEEILQRLEANLNHYDTGVPSFFCDEHVISQVESGLRNQDTITDSVFRLKRIPAPTIQQLSQSHARSRRSTASQRLRRIWTVPPCLAERLRAASPLSPSTKQPA